MNILTSIAADLRRPAFQNLDAYRVENWWPEGIEHVGLSISMGRSSALQAWHIVEANGGLLSERGRHDLKAQEHQHDQS